MSERQWKRLDAVERLEQGKLGVGAVAQVLGLSTRQVRRLRQSIKRRGKAAIIHGNTGRRPKNRTPEKVRIRIIELARGKYAGFNDTHLTDKLVEEEKVKLSRASVQRILRGNVVTLPGRQATLFHEGRNRKRIALSY